MSLRRCLGQVVPGSNTSPPSWAQAVGSVAAGKVRALRRAQGDARGGRGAPGSLLFSGAARLREGGPDPAAHRAAVKAPRGGPGGTALPLPAPTGPSEGLAPPPRQGNGPGRLHSGQPAVRRGSGAEPMSPARRRREPAGSASSRAAPPR